MDEDQRDDAPAGFRLSRRSVVAGAAVAAAGMSLTPLSALHAEPAPVDTAAFMQLSRLLIPHRLDDALGKRIASAMSGRTRDLNAQVAGLLAIASARNARVVEDFFADVPTGPLKTTALAIISTWYTGVMADAPGEQVFAFELALVFQPTRDVMTIPTYAIGKPNGWTAVSPPLGSVPRFRADTA